jgi:hypothetical protein
MTGLQVATDLFPPFNTNATNVSLVVTPAALGFVNDT